jgi:ABC-2 type transport system ATP-binding protein
MVGDLPAGVLQQVALVSATMHDPDIVFLDEPTAGVTPHARSRFWELIACIAKAGKTVFVTTHYMDEAEQCGRVALMRAGELIALGSPASLKAGTFPEPLFELTPAKGAPRDWQQMLGAQPFVKEMTTFGMRSHVVVSDPTLFLSYVNIHLPGCEQRRIEPSLEDVFIRVVEGSGR